ncbi:hypothetical protein [Streptomyces sp. NPDC006333]|uniref:hypothetical protein n=1 Tax=Streptomyces sp. NPDC006333 TaxID=3156753 RepID=UPI0033A6DB31
MIRPQLTVDGTAIRLPLADRVGALVDELALAYAQDPKGIGRLLAAHAGAVFGLDYAECSEDMPDHVRAIRAAEADGTREGLLGHLPSADRLDDQLGPDDAVTLATRLTKLAASIRRNQTRSSRT